MRITAVRTRRFVLPLDPPFCPAWDPVPRRSFEATIVTVETDEGLSGVASGDLMDGFARYEHLFVGSDPLDIDRHVRTLETITFHAGRYWPVEAALWDIAGKAQGRSVASLLGGAETRLRAYASWAEIRSAAARKEDALRMREEGFGAIKIRIERERIDLGLETVAAVRGAIGSDLELMVDLNQAWRMPGDIEPALAPDAVRRVTERLREHGIFWLEEPLPGADVRGYAALRAETGVLIAGGEMARTTAELDAFLEADALDVYQPDAVLAVGVLRGAEVARQAMQRGRFFTPHTWTNGIGLAVNLQLTAGVGGGPFLEFPYDPPGWTPERRDFMLAEPLRVDRGGFLHVPEQPGLGFELDAEKLERYAVG